MEQKGNSDCKISQSKSSALCSLNRLDFGVLLPLLLLLELLRLLLLLRLNQHLTPGLPVAPVLGQDAARAGAADQDGQKDEKQDGADDDEGESHNTENK